MLKKKLIIIDQNFKDYRGHHFYYNYDLYQFYKNKFDIKFYTSKGLKKNINNLFNGKLKPYFKEDVKINYKTFLLKIINYIKKRRIVKYFHQTFVQFTFILKIIDILFKRKENKNHRRSQLIEVVKFHKHSNILIHTLSSIEFLDFLIDLKNLENNSNKIFIVFRRDPRELDEYYDLIRYYLKEQDINILTDSHKIKTYFKNKNIEIKQIKIPIGTKSKKNQFLKKKKFKISYLGDARYEKGFFDLQNLLNNTNDKNFFYTIQSNDNGYDLDLLKKTKKELRKKKNVTLIDKQLKDKDYNKHLCQSDLVLIPYKKNFYKYRTSGIFYESILCGIPCIVTDDTWMSSFYKSKTLKKLILKENNNLNDILKFFSSNYKLIQKEIEILRRNILIKNNSKNYEILSNTSKIKSKTKNSFFSYVTSGDMLLRGDDGNRFASRHIFNILSKSFFLKQFNALDINILCNQNINSNIKHQVVKKILVDKYFPKIKFNFIGMRNNFILKNSNLNFIMSNISSKIILNDIIVVNFHYYTELINDLSILKLKKIIVIVHDVFNKINKYKEQFIDKENIYYVFISYAEYESVNFESSKKYLIFPFKDKKKTIKSSKQKMKKEYYYISSGSDMDIKNLKIFLKEKYLERNKIKLNLVGSICQKINQDIFKNSHVNCLGFININKLEKLYKNQKSCFLILRYYGSGIPVKMLEAIRYNSKFLLFGDKKKFGIPSKYLEIVNETKKNLENKISNVDFERSANEIYNYTRDNNYINLKKMQKDLYENF